MQNFIKVYGRTSSCVMHMEIDLQTRGGNIHVPTILFSNQYALRKTNGRRVEIIAGDIRNGYQEAEKRGDEARFHNITGFAQLNTSQIVVVDYGNHCLRMINRETGTTFPFFGNCSRISSTGDVYFHKPYSVLFDNSSDSLLVTVIEASMVYQINMQTKEAFTLMAIVRPIGMVTDMNKEFFYFTSLESVYISKFNTRKNTTTNITAIIDPRFGYGRILEKLTELLLLADGLILVADQKNDLIRVIEFGDRNCIWVFCSGKKPNLNGAHDECELRGPASLLLVGDTLFIGVNNGIQMVNGEKVLVYLSIIFQI